MTDRAFAYATTPVPLILDPSATLLEHRLYDWIDHHAGPRGYWDDSLVAIAESMGASRRHLGEAAKRLEARGLIVREQRGHWRTRFVVVERVRGKQLPLDEHPPEVRGGEPVRRRGVSPFGAGGEPVRRRIAGSHLYSDKEVFTKKITQRSGRAAGEQYNRNIARSWEDVERRLSG